MLSTIQTRMRVMKSYTNTAFRFNFIHLVYKLKDVRLYLKYLIALDGDINIYVKRNAH